MLIGYFVKVLFGSSGLREIEKTLKIEEGSSSLMGGSVFVYVFQLDLVFSVIVCVASIFIM